MTARIFVGDDVRELAIDREYALPERAARHVAQALRMRSGDAIVLFTGRGGEYVGTIERCDRREVVVRVRRHVAIERENAFPVTLVQAVIASDMMDFVVRKAVELGVAAIAPIQSARSQGLPPERMRRRVEHWRQIAIAACEQCGRNRVPPVHEVVTWLEWPASAPRDGLGVILDAGAADALAVVVRRSPPATIVSGPEGGFTADEIHAAIAHGLVAAHLGPRMLRAETAPLAALATIDALREHGK